MSTKRYYCTYCGRCRPVKFLKRDTRYGDASVTTLPWMCRSEPKCEAVLKAQARRLVERVR